MPQTVSMYLGYARECAALADKMTGTDKAKLMDVAEAWLRLADDAAKRAGQSPLTADGDSRQHK